MAIAVTGAAAVVQSLPDLPRVVGDRSFLLLVVLTVASGLANFRMLGARFTFSVSDSFTMTTAVLFGPAAATVLVAFDAFAMSLRLTRENRTAGRVFYNTTAPALAMWIASHAFDTLAPAAFRTQPTPGAQLVIPLMVFAGLYFLLNTGLIAMAVAGERHESLPHVWAAYFAKLWFTFFVGASVAGLLVLLAGIGSGNSMVIVLLVPLVVVLYAAAHGAVEQLRERREHLAERELFATALGSTADAVLLTDPDRRVTFMNPAAERLTGWSDASGRGRADADVFRVCHPKTREPNLDPAAREGAVVAEYILIRPDGTECAIEEMHAPIRDDTGQLRGLVWTFRDIAERKAARALEEKQAALRAALQIKDEFVAVVAHELRTPIGTIVGWARMLEERSVKPERVEAAIAAIRRSADSLRQLIDDLMDTSQLTSGRMRLTVGHVDLREVIHDAVEAVRFSADNKGVVLTASIPRDRPLLQGDAGRLKQVVWNLLANAIKFTPAGGHVTIVLSAIECGFRVEVSDTGSGIEPEFLPYVFERFRQATTGPSQAGVGLGLAIVRHLVELHGGTVSAYSAGRGKGAKFAIELPLIPTAQAVSSTWSSASAGPYK